MHAGACPIMIANYARVMLSEAKAAGWLPAQRRHAAHADCSPAAQRPSGNTPNMGPSALPGLHLELRNSGGQIDQLSHKSLLSEYCFCARYHFSRGKFSFKWS